MIPANSADIQTRAIDAVLRFQAAEHTGSPDLDVERELREIAAEAVAALNGRHDFTCYIRNRLYTWCSGELSVQYYGRGPSDGTWKMQNIVEDAALRVKIVRNFLRDFPWIITARRNTIVVF
jgi:hypothetical protein